MTDLTMPRLSDSMEEGRIVAWLVDEGATVVRGAPLVEIETDKATVTHEAESDGVLVEVVVPDGGGAAVGAVIARFAAAGAVAASRTPTVAVLERSASATGRRASASPVARRLARELGVDLGSLRGSGPRGRIVKADIEAAGARRGQAGASDARPAPTPPPGSAVPQTGGAKGETSVHALSRLQATVARRMAESKATAPDIALSLTVDMTQAVALRARLKELQDPAPSFNDMVVKAAAIALRAHPRVNGAYRDGRFELYERVNVGIAVAALDALVVPTVFDADTKSLGQIARDTRMAALRVRDQTITPAELVGATFTVSNLGMLGIERFTAIVNPPQAAILAVGKLAPRPAVSDEGAIAARDQMELTLVCDHRILYGADGARFLSRVQDLLEQPLSLALA